jgi:hypothetical protein
MTQIATSEPPPLATRLLKAPAKSVVLAAATFNVVLACLGVLLPDGASTVLGTLPILIVAWRLGALAAVPIVLIAALASSPTWPPHLQQVRCDVLIFASATWPSTILSPEL